MKLKEDIKRRWVDALLSTPRNKQTIGTMKEGDRHCAVGVLAELAADDGVLAQDWHLRSLPQNKFLKWALDSEGPFYPGDWNSILALPSAISTVTCENDQGTPWPVIADAIKNDL